MRRERIDYEYLLRHVLPLSRLAPQDRQALERVLLQGTSDEIEEAAHSAVEKLRLSGILRVLEDRELDGERLVRYSNVLDASILTIRVPSRRTEKGLVRIPTPLPYWSSKTPLPTVRKILSLGDRILTGDSQPLTGMNEVLELFLESTREILGADHGALVFAADTLDAFRCLEAISSPHPFDRALTETAVIGEKTLISIPDLQAYPGGQRLAGYRSLAVAPILSNEPPIRGAIEAWSRSPRFFTDEKLALLSLLAEQGSGLVQKAARLSKLVFFDPLTQVYNRSYFNVQVGNELARARREGEPLALVIADIDDFKHFNSRFGYAGGNEVLKAIAQILVRSVRPFDFVTRWGGEEFALVLTPPVTEQAARSICERLRAAVEATAFRMPDMAGVLRAAPLSLSIGAAMFPQDADSGEALWHSANCALLRGKERGKNRVIFVSEMN
jgi:diguanylate cyclase (GGDEF)-like protein